MSLRHLIYLLVFILAVAIQWPLWFGKGGVLRMQALEAELASVRAANDRLRAENDAAAAEIESLESGSGAVSERARMRLGMIRSDEILFRLVPKGKNAAPVPEIPEKPTGKQQIFSPKRSDLYVPGSIEDGQEAQQKSRTP
ncbi:septum formation initiator family protein [Duodenibacillus massiliensis]|uniref:septum formation initiator family protein n=1 Tax=Duodenibacillus massiliensis TaxID=1852381 RepID=UPI000EC6EB28|nr:septum formation initiator family protein [Duodenibacillus massiliensis]HAF65018.1 cell division protein FtsB [Sutterella sp.]